MKPVREWVEADLMALIRDDVRESRVVEYKKSAALRVEGKALDNLKAELSKDVSALANADGGIIVFGVAESGTSPKAIDDGFGPDDRSQEWLENVVRNNISGQLGEIAFKTIALSSAHAGKHAYAIEVGPSPAGCQARDGRYYRRRETCVEWLQDWEVRELLGRSARPIVKARFERLDARSDGDNERVRVRVTVSNEGHKAARDVRLVFAVAARFEPKPNAALARRHPHEHGYTTQHTGRPHVDGCEIAVTASKPLFPMQSVIVIDETTQNDLSVVLPRDSSADDTAVVTWTLWADDMVPQAGIVTQGSLRAPP